MDDTALLRRVAAAIDWNVDDFLAYAASGKATARLNASNTVAFEHGVFGVPTMLVDDQLWWGNDRLEFLEKYLVESANEQKA